MFSSLTCMSSDVGQIGHIFMEGSLLKVTKLKISWNLFHILLTLWGYSSETMYCLTLIQLLQLCLRVCQFDDRQPHSNRCTAKSRPILYTEDTRQWANNNKHWYQKLHFGTQFCRHTCCWNEWDTELQSCRAQSRAIDRLTELLSVIWKY